MYKPMNKNPEANQNKKTIIIALIIGAVIILGIVGIVIYKQRERESKIHNHKPILLSNRLKIRLFSN